MFFLNNEDLHGERKTLWGAGSRVSVRKDGAWGVFSGHTLSPIRSLAAAEGPLCLSGGCQDLQEGGEERRKTEAVFFSCLLSRRCGSPHGNCCSGYCWVRRRTQVSGRQRSLVLFLSTCPVYSSWHSVL